MKTVNLSCIGCPLGCELTVEIDGEDIKVSGNTCRIGAEYGRAEVTAPVRTLTSSVRLEGGELPLVSVRSDKPIPKEKIFDCMKVIRAAFATAPVIIGDILIKDCAGTGADMIATKNVKAKA